MQIPAIALSGPRLTTFLLQLGVLLGLALLLGRLAAWLRMPAIAGELLAGIILGPTALGRAGGWWLGYANPRQSALLQAIGQLGVLLLVALTAAQLDAGLLRRNRATALRVSLASAAIPLACGTALGFALPVMMLGKTGQRGLFAFFLGVAICASAIPVIARILLDLRLEHRDIGQLILTTAAIVDAAGWLLLSVISALAVSGLRAGPLARSLLGLVLVAVVAATIGPVLVRTALRLVARASRLGDPGPTAAAVVVLVTGAAAGTQALGYEPVLGAFAAGIVIGRCGDVARPALDRLRPVVASVLSPVFFALAGLQVNLELLAHQAALLAGATVLAVAVTSKLAGTYLGARASRMNRWESLGVGAALNARGMVEIIIATVGLRLGVLNATSYTVVVLVAVITSLMAPPLLRFAVARLDETDSERRRHTQIDGQAAGVPARLLPDGAT
jgi:Kef-type K+ transport system membrane component KefB